MFGCQRPLEVLVRWGIGEKSINGLPILSLMPLCPPGTDRMYGSTRVNNTRFQILGIQKHFFRFSTYMGNFTFFKKRFSR